MLTARQHAVLSYIRGYTAKCGIPPTLAEIAAGIGIRSRSAVHRQLRSLEDAGHICLLAGRKRGIKIVSDEPVASVPLAGRVAAGHPIEAIEGRDSIDLLDFLVRDNHYALSVVGDSMIAAGILSGDTVIVERRDTANNGDIVVALIDNEQATIKRLERCRNGTMNLVPEHPNMTPMNFAAERVTIQGVVVAQIRRYQ